MFPSIAMARAHHDAYLRSHLPRRRWTEQRDRRPELRG